MTNTLPRHDIDAIRRVFDMDEIVEAMRRAFSAYARGKIGVESAANFEL